MSSSTGIKRLVVLSGLAGALMGCATTGSYLTRDTELATYHTYAWRPGIGQATGDPRLDNNPFFHGRIVADVEKALAARGFEKSTAAVPDLIVHYHASVVQEVDLNGADQSYRASESEPFVYEAGTLAIDVMDARTNGLVWRGWVKGAVDGIVDDQEMMEERIDEAVTRVMERFPRKLAGV